MKKAPGKSRALFYIFFTCAATFLCYNKNLSIFDEKVGKSMTFQLEESLGIYQAAVKRAFGSRVEFIGLQGSYQRGEAHPGSDLDLVLILDTVDFKDIKTYKGLIAEMPFSALACGFISGAAELLAWPKADLFQFVNDTRPLYGDLAKILPPLTRAEVAEAFRTGAANLYHAACHSYLFEAGGGEAVKGLYKMLFFVMQAKYMLENAVYLPTKKELLEHLEGEDAMLLRISLGEEPIADVSPYYDRLIRWCSQALRAVTENS